MIVIENYNPFVKTAIKRKGLSAPMKVLLDKQLLKGNVLDYGCGHHQDCDILSKQFFIKGYDKHNPLYKDESLLIDYYDTVTCHYVFNVIPEIKQHQRLITQLKLLSDNVYISVRSDVKAIRPFWEYSDKHIGYWTTRGNFQRFYTKDMVKQLFGNVSFIHHNESFILFKFIYLHK